MKAQLMLDFGQPLEERELPRPSPEDSEVLIKILACGVCHSDVHIHDGYLDLGEGAKLGLPISLPHILGHEIAGQVVAKGPEVQGTEIGDIGVVYPWIGCGLCGVCRHGAEHLCSDPRDLGVRAAGGFGEYLLLPHRRYLIDSGDLSPHLACTYACCGLTAFGALNKIGPVGESEKVAFIGIGGVGSMALHMAKPAFSLSPIAVDINSDKLVAAKAAGAKFTVNGSKPNAAEELAAIGNGNISTVLDFVGNQQSVELSLRILAKGGKLIIVGLYGGLLRYPLPLLPIKALTLIGSYVGSLTEMGEMMELAKAGKIAPIPIETRSFCEANQALEDLKQGRVAGRIVLLPPDI